MEAIQKMSDSRKVKMGAMGRLSTKATCPNQQEVKATTYTAHMIKPTQPNCVNPKPCTLKQSKGTEPGGTNTAGE